MKDGPWGAHVWPLTFLVSILALACAWSLALGTVPLPIADVYSALVGAGEPRVVIVVQEIRLPRVLSLVL